MVSPTYNLIIIIIIPLYVPLLRDLPSTQNCVSNVSTEYVLRHTIVVIAVRIEQGERGEKLSGFPYD